MPKTAKIDLHSLRNAEHIHFHSEILKSVDENLADELGISAAREKYAAAFAREKRVFNQGRSYASTPQLKAKKKLQTQIFQYIKQTLRANGFSTNEARQTASRELQRCMAPFAMAYTRSNAVAAAEIAKLVAVFQKEECRAWLETLGLTEAVGELAEANAAFNAACVERADEHHERISREKMKAVRPEVDSAYEELMEALRAIRLVNSFAAEKNPVAETRITPILDLACALLLQLEDARTRRRRGNAAKKPPEPKDST